MSFRIGEDIELTGEEIKNLIKVKLANLRNLGEGTDYIKELSEIAFLQIEIEQLFDAEINLEICLKHFKNQRDSLGQAATLGIFGTLYFKKGEYQKSIDGYQEAYKIYAELNQFQEQIICLKGIGISFIKLNRFEEAVDTFLNCSAICSDNNDIYNLLDCLGNLIYIYESQEKWDVVFELYKKILHAFKELKDNQGIITSYFNLGILQKKSNKNDLALRYFKKGTNKAIDTNFDELIIKGLSYIAETLFYLGKLKDASNELIKALYLAERINAKNAIIQIKILLNSLGLREIDVENMLEQYKKSKKQEY